MRGNWLLAALSSLTLIAPAAGAEPKPSPESAVRAAIESYVAAFNRGDAAAVAEHWAEDADYVLPSGEHVHGRAAIQKVFEALFAPLGRPRIELGEVRVRMIGKNVAIEEGAVRVTAPGKPLEDSRYLAVHVKQGKAWKLNTVRETSLPAPPANAAQEQLKGLDWLVGHWTEESLHGTNQTRFEWSKNRSFLTGQFKLALPEGKTLEGTQVVAWDPESRVIRSWLFDSDGGFGEGIWARRENSWSVNFVQVLPDGRRASATNIYTHVGENAFEWKSIDRKIGGELAANIGPVRIVRSGAAESASKPDDAPRKSIK